MKKLLMRLILHPQSALSVHSTPRQTDETVDTALSVDDLFETWGRNKTTAEVVCIAVQKK